MPDAMPQPRRLHRKSYDCPGHAHFLTFTTNHNFPLFSDPDFALLFLRKLNLTRERHGFEVCAYVVMPDHVHLLIWSDSESFRISRALQAIKQPFSIAVLERLQEANDPRSKHLLKVDKDGSSEGRVWQKGGGYDRNMFTEKATREVIDYIHQNPVNAGLCEAAEDYRWSSAAWYSEGRGDFRVDPARL